MPRQSKYLSPGHEKNGVRDIKSYERVSPSRFWRSDSDGEIIVDGDRPIPRVVVKSLYTLHRHGHSLDRYGMRTAYKVIGTQNDKTLLLCQLDAQKVYEYDDIPGLGRHASRLPDEYIPRINEDRHEYVTSFRCQWDTGTASSGSGIPQAEQRMIECDNNGNPKTDCWGNQLNYLLTFVYLHDAPVYRPNGSRDGLLGCSGISPVSDTPGRIGDSRFRHIEAWEDCA